MKISSLILLMHWSLVLGDLCSFGGWNWHVKAALYFKSQLILFASDQNVYHIKDFEFKNGKISKNSVKKTTLLSEWLVKDELRYIFRYEDEVISLNWEAVSDIRRLVGFKLYINNEFTAITSKLEFKVNMYTYTPNEDPLNLMSLLAKFPENDIQKNIKSIVSFPFGEPGLSNRFFVYYLERPLDSDSKNQDRFKRHIMIANKTSFGNKEEMNWVHDKISGNCIPEDVVIDTAVRLSDKYIRSSNRWTFDIMEFSGTQYSIKGVQIEKTEGGTRVLKDMVTHETGSIEKLFVCDEKPREETKYPGETTKAPTKGLEWLKIVLIFLVVFFIVAIAVVIFFIAKAVIRIKQNRSQRVVSKTTPKEDQKSHSILTKTSTES